MKELNISDFEVAHVEAACQAAGFWGTVNPLPSFNAWQICFDDGTPRLWVINPRREDGVIVADVFTIHGWDGGIEGFCGEIQFMDF